MSLQKLYEEQAFTDLTIRIVNESGDIVHMLHVHKCVMYMQCEYFKALLSGSFMESNTNVIDLVTEFPDTMKSVILSLYDLKEATSDPKTIHQVIICKSYILLNIDKEIDVLNKTPIQDINDLSNRIGILQTCPDRITLMKEIYEYLFYDFRFSPEKYDGEIISLDHLIFLRNMCRLIAGFVCAVPLNPKINLTHFIYYQPNHIGQVKRRLLDTYQKSTPGTNSLLFNDLTHIRSYFWRHPRPEKFQASSAFMIDRHILRRKYVNLEEPAQSYLFIYHPIRYRIIYRPSRIICFQKNSFSYCMYDDDEIENDPYKETQVLKENIKDIFCSDSRKYFLITHENSVTLLEVPNCLTNFEGTFTNVIPFFDSDEFIVCDAQNKLYRINCGAKKIEELNVTVPLGSLTTLDKDNSLVFFNPSDLHVSIMWQTGQIISKHLLSNPTRSEKINWEKTRRIICDKNNFMYIECEKQIFRVDMLDEHKIQILHSSALEEQIVDIIEDQDVKKVISSLDQIIRERQTKNND